MDSSSSSSSSCSSSLFNAAASGDIATLRQLASGSDSGAISAVTSNGNTALHIAVMLGHDEFAREACSLDASLLSVANSDDNTPLIIAAMAGHTSLATFFIQCLPAGADRKSMLLMANRYENTALHEALRGSHPSLALELLQAEPDLSKSVNKWNESPMFMAAARGLVDVVTAMLRIPDSLDRGPAGENALHAAVRIDNLDTARILMDARPGLCKGQQKAEKCTPLHIAAWCNQLEMVQLLLEFDPTVARMGSNTGRTPLHYATGAGCIEVAKEIYKRCPDSAFLVNNYGKNIIHNAVNNENFDGLKYMMEIPEFEMLINQPDQNGDTPLHLAAMNRDPKAIYTLLQANKRLDLAARNEKGDTALTRFYRDTDKLNTLQWHETYLLLKRHIKDTYISTWNRPRKILTDKAVKEIRSLTKTYTNNTTVVAILMSTVTFAAAFTVPGGYNNDQGPDQGLPLLARKLAFKVFLISDAMSMCASIVVAFLCIFARQDIDFLAHYKGSTKKLLWCAFVMMMIAFATGLYTVIAPDNLWLAVLLCVICCILPFFTYAVGKWPIWKLQFHTGKPFQPGLIDLV